MVTEAMPTSRAAALGVWVGVGARDEPTELSGVSHFLEHLLFKGTATRSGREISAAVDRVGGDMNAYTMKEATAFYARVPATELALAVELMGDVVTAPALRDDDVEAERQVILEELRMDDDLPEDRAHSLLQESLFPEHPLGRETAGTAESVEVITAAEVRSFFERWYRPSNFVVAASGAVDHDEVVRLVERHLDGSRRRRGLGRGAKASSAASRPARLAPEASPRAVAVLRRRCEQVHLALGVSGLPHAHPDAEALELLHHALGGGMSSRLFDEVRDRRGLAYSVYSSTASYVDAGTFTVYAGTQPAHLDEVVGLIRSEVAKVIESGLTADELDVAKGYVAGAFVLGLESPTSRMARLAEHLSIYGRVLTVDEELARFRAVTSDDVARVAHEVLGRPWSAAAVGPVSAKHLRPLLA